MGYQKDQSFPGSTYRPGAEGPPRASQANRPPPLPPRASSPLLTLSDAPPTYQNAIYGQPLTQSWTGQDPRGRSTDSLLPLSGGRDGRRRLLLIFIHGFLGNELSFQSFPAHVHNLVTSKLSETHVVHTKIYPRYKSRKAIEYARDDFSNWLCPHESPDTDVVLLGHSMGGILAAEVALLPPFSVADRDMFRHRILGTVNFDTPFLGMHPGVIVSGISSLFKPKPASPTLQPQDALLLPPSTALRPTTPDGTTPTGQRPPQQSQQGSQQPLGSEYFSSQSQLDQVPSGPATSQSAFSPLATPVNDPNYNPPFANDVRLPVRKGWDSTLHFIMKHSDGLTKATKSYVTSHLEFGGCLADYRGLKNRYERIRALEDVDDSAPASAQMHRPARRIRFVNYYTASTGRAPTGKQPSTPAEQQMRQQVDKARSRMDQEMQDMSITGTASTRSRSPHISIEDPEGVVVAEILGNEDDGDGPEVDVHLDASHEMDQLPPNPVPDDKVPSSDGANDRKFDKPVPVSTHEAIPNSQRSSLTSSTISLPPLPPSPTAPAPFDPTPYTDKDALKLAEKEYTRRTKLYKQALKDRDTAIKERRQLFEKKEKAARQAREKAVKAEEKERLKREKEELKKGNVNPPPTSPEPKQLRSVSSEPIPPSTSPSLRCSSPADIDAGPLVYQAGDGAPFSRPTHESSSSTNPAPLSHQSTSTTTTPASQKAKRDRKFCMLPPKADGQRDPCWSRIFMEGVDEVGAHCGLFVAGKPHYTGLVQNVGERISGWVIEKEEHIGNGGG